MDSDRAVIWYIMPSSVEEARQFVACDDVASREYPIGIREDENWELPHRLALSWLSNTKSYPPLGRRDCHNNVCIDWYSGGRVRLHYSDDSASGEDEFGHYSDTGAQGIVSSGYNVQGYVFCPFRLDFPGTVNYGLCRVSIGYSGLAIKGRLRQPAIDDFAICIADIFSTLENEGVR